MAETEFVEAQEIVPQEGPQTEVTQLLVDENPEIRLARLKKIAELAPQFEEAMRTILLSCTFPQDWEMFGEGDKAKVCLSSAGAERLGKHFPIRFFEVKSRKEGWEDAEGKGYRYIFEGKATLGDRIMFAQGCYSTRDKFLGFAHGEWKPLEQINENHIRNAAYHIFCGNAIKGLLGLRALPVSQYQHLMNRTGQQAAQTTGHTYGSGTKGGTSASDHDKQKELAEACIVIANAGFEAELDGDGKCILIPLSADVEGITDNVAVAKSICEIMSSFPGKKDGEIVPGLPASKLKGKRLEITLKKAKELLKELNQ